MLRPLFQCLAGNRIEEVVGILNGTTNYILTRMVKGGVSFEDALKMEAAFMRRTSATPLPTVPKPMIAKLAIVLASAHSTDDRPANLKVVA